MRELLQNVMILLQNATFITKWVSTVISFTPSGLRQLKKKIALGKINFRTSEGFQSFEYRN